MTVSRWTLAAVAWTISIAVFASDNVRGSEWCHFELPDGQPYPPRLNLPQWACDLASEKRLDETYAVYERINPFFLTGDFDGDNKTDIAIWVMKRATRQLGVIVLHRGSRTIHILAAGTKGNRGPTFRGLDWWTLYPKGPVERSYHESFTPILKGDALMLGKSEASAFLLYWNGKRYIYYTVSD